MEAAGAGFSQADDLHAVDAVHQVQREKADRIEGGDDGLSPGRSWQRQQERKEQDQESFHIGFLPSRCGMLMKRISEGFHCSQAAYLSAGKFSRMMRASISRSREGSTAP